MARDATITQEQVSAAAESIKANGGKVGSRAVREMLGSGSMGTILKFVQVWQAGQERKSEAIDDSIDPAIVRAISNQIAAKVQEATANATASLADLQSDTTTIIAENERQAAELDTVTTMLAKLTEQNAAQAGRIEQLEAEASRITSELVTERQAVEVARINLAKAELRLEAVPRIEAEIVQVRAELATERTRSAEQHEAAAVAIARFEAAVEKSNGLALQLNEANAKVQFTVEAVSKEKLIVQGLHDRLEVADKLVRDTRADLTSVMVEAKQSADEAAELRGRLSSLTKA